MGKKNKVKRTTVTLLKLCRVLLISSVLHIYEKKLMLSQILSEKYIQLVVGLCILTKLQTSTKTSNIRTMIICFGKLSKLIAHSTLPMQLTSYQGIRIFDDD
jgi:hypothetical protein